MNDMEEKGRRVTIKDIAAHTGYSIATVSRVINGMSMYYSEGTREKIQKAIERFNYHPNLLAKGLKERRTFTIAYLVPQIDDFYSGIYNGMQSEAHARGYSIAIFSSDYHKRKEKANIAHILEKQYDGVIVATGLLNENDNEKLADIFPGTAVVLLEGMEPCANVSRVCVDVEGVFGRAIDYLVGLGHRKIAYVSAPCSFDSLRYRYRGYVNALRAHGIEPDPSLIHFDPGLGLSRFDECYAVAQKVLRKPDFTAMLIMSDWAAFTAIRVVNEMGLKVPEDISIIGFDNLPFTEFSQPALTTISQNSDALAAHGIRLLLDRLNGRAAEDVCLGADLILRQSVAAVKR